VPDQPDPRCYWLHINLSEQGLHMKKALVLSAIAATLAAPAFAQSSVQVYGRLNVSLENQTMVGDTKNNTLQNSSSRIGFKGTEDLGGGLKAGFVIESGFNPANGQASGTFWGRESHVDLAGSFGKVRLGNMGPTMAYFTLADYISNHNHDTGTSSDAFYLYPGRATKMIAYTSPEMGGVTVDVQYGLKSTDPKATTVLTANYEGGPLHLGGAYVNATDGTKETGVRAAYDIGAVTLGAYVVRNTDIGGVAGVDRTALRASAMYTMGATELHANVGKAGKVGGVAGSDANQYTLGVNQNLSKRTKLYAFYTKLAGNAGDAYATVANGGVKNSLALGVRHNF
jgi:predicted porin